MVFKHSWPMGNKFYYDLKNNDFEIYVNFKNIV
jgi:hypothetical protein